MLEAKAIRSGYGDVEILKGVDFAVGDEVFAVLGANGAGKTTLLATIAGLLPVMSGELLLDGEPIGGLPPWVTAAKGLAYVPQERGVFRDLTVLENLNVGGMVGRSRSRKERIDEVLTTFPALAQVRHQPARTLSGGESRMLAAGRALMQEPRILLLDEPTAGLAPMYVDLFYEAIASIRAARRLSILIAEQNASKVLEVADRVVVLSLGTPTEAVDAVDVTTDRLRAAYQIDHPDQRRRSAGPAT
jgi:branched-chain amino acid transport system ATP-binding protein